MRPYIVWPLALIIALKTAVVIGVWVKLRLHESARQALALIAFRYTARLLMLVGLLLAFGFTSRDSWLIGVAMMAAGLGAIAVSDIQWLIKCFRTRRRADHA